MKLKKKCKRCGRESYIEVYGFGDIFKTVIKPVSLCEDCMTKEELDDIVSDIRKGYDEIKKTVGDDDDY